jgi:hypothetical protein
VCPEVAIINEIPDGGYHSPNLPYMSRR